MDVDSVESRGKRKAGSTSPTPEASSATRQPKRQNISGTSAVAVHDDDGAEEDSGNPSEGYEDTEGSEAEWPEFEPDEEEDMGPPEEEVEEMEYEAGATKLSLKIFLQEDGDEFEGWMKTIHVHCSYQGKVIGTGLGRFVQRNWIRCDFWQAMEEPCQELSTVAFELFDRYGRLLPEFKHHIIRKGSGAWGDELSRGSLFIVESLCVEREWRRKGVGSKIARCLLDKSGTGGRSVGFSLVRPGWLNHEIEPDLAGKSRQERWEVQRGAMTPAIAFWRSLGFRRIGASGCFGLPVDPSHPAHEIHVTSDFDPQEEQLDVEEGMEALKERLPLHHAVITLADGECVEAFKASASWANQIPQVDRHAKNILHVAACELKVESVRWLMNNANDNLALSMARDVKGYTPLEALESQLESKRTRLEDGIVRSDSFTGYPHEAIECLAALKTLGSLSLIQYSRLKFGCTCDACIEGFLSPRMTFALLCQAEIKHDMMNGEVDNAEGWFLCHDYDLIYVAPHLQQNFRTNKSLRQGFSNMFHHAAVVLTAGLPPTPQNVLQAWRDQNEWPPVTRSFLERGGTAESALRRLVDLARDGDEWAGDGEYINVFEDDIKNLPECRNDHEFGFVARVCGLKN